MDLGACAVGAFYDRQQNESLRLNDEDEAVLYLVSVGKVSQKSWNRRLWHHSLGRTARGRSLLHVVPVPGFLDGLGLEHRPGPARESCQVLKGSA